MARGHYIKSGQGYRYDDVFYVSLEEARQMLMEKYEPTIEKMERKLRRSKKI